MIKKWWKKNNNPVRNWWNNNKFHLIIPGLLLIFAIGMFFGGGDEAEPKNIGGLAVLIIAAGVFFVATRSTISDKATNWLVAIGIAMILLWALTRLIAAFETVTGQEFGMLSLLLVFMAFIVWKKRGGFLGKAALFLVACAWLGGSSSIFVEGLASFSKGLGFKKTPSVVSEFKGYFHKDLENLAARKKAHSQRGELLANRALEKSKVMYVSKKTGLYNCTGGKCSSKVKYEFKGEHVEVIVLDETQAHNGIEVTKVKLPVPGTNNFVDGPEAFVATSQLLTKAEALGVPELTSNSMANQAIGWILAFFQAYWLLILLFVLLYLVYRAIVGRRAATGGSPLGSVGKLAKFAVVMVVILVVGYVFYGVVLCLGEQLFSVDLTEVGSSSAQVQAEPETRISLVPGIYEPGQTFEMLVLPQSKYKKIVLTEDIRVEKVSNGEFADVTAQFGIAGKGKKVGGKARLKWKPGWAVSKYVDVERKHTSPMYIKLPKGSIIEFGYGDVPSIILYSSGSGYNKIRLVPEKEGEPIFFAYRKYTG